MRRVFHKLYRPYTYLISIVICSLPLTPIAGSQDLEAETPDIVITIANRLNGLTPDQLTSASSIFTEEDITARGQTYVADLLRSLPGLSVNSSGNASQLTQLRLRGTEANHVLVLIDGIEASDPNSGEFNFSNLYSKDIIGIEVLRGEQSALWGSDAIGGVINIITRAHQTDPGYQAYFEGGRFNSFDNQLSATLPLGNATLTLNGHMAATSGYDISGLGSEPDSSENGQLSIALNRLQFGGINVNARISHGYSQTAFDSDTDFDGRLNNSTENLITHNWLGRLESHFILSGFTHKIIFNLTDTKTDTRQSTFPNATRGLRQQVNWTAGRTFGHHKIIVLAESERESFRNFGGMGAIQNQNQHIQTHAMALDYRYQNEGLTFTASAREDFNSRFATNFSWQVGLSYPVSFLNGRLYGSYGIGVKNPTLTEIFGFFPGSFTGNPDIQQERSKGFNVGYEMKWRTGQLGIDYFSSRLQNEILTIFNPDFTSTVRNNTQISRREGIEVEGRWKPFRNLNLHVSGTWLKATENGESEIRRPEWSASASAVWQPIKPVNLNISVNYTGEQVDMDFATFSRVVLDDFILLGFNFNYQLNPQLNLYVRGENVGNAIYEEVVGYSPRPRSLYSGIRVSF